MAVIAFYNQAQSKGLATDIERKCKSHGLTSFRGWGQPPAVVCSALPPVKTGGFCIIAEISMVCKKFCGDLPDAAGGYGIRPYGVGGDARHRPGNVATAVMCPGRTMFAPTAPFSKRIVGRGLDPSAGRCEHRPLQKRPAGEKFPSGPFFFSYSYNN